MEGEFEWSRETPGSSLDFYCREGRATIAVGIEVYFAEPEEGKAGMDGALVFQEAGGFIWSDLNESSLPLMTDANDLKSATENEFFRLLDLSKFLHGDLLPVGNAGGETGRGGLFGHFQSRLTGQKTYLGFRQTGFFERGDDLKFFRSLPTRAKIGGIIGIFPIGDCRPPFILGESGEMLKKFRLAVKAAVDRVGFIIRVFQFVRLNHAEWQGVATTKITRLIQFAAGQAGGIGNDAETTFAEDLMGLPKEIGTVNPPGKSDEEIPTGGKLLLEFLLLGKRRFHPCTLHLSGGEYKKIGFIQKYFTLGCALSMSLIIQKYGGTSVGNPERIRNVARRVSEYRKQGHQIVVVVSAMSGVTDSLIKLAREVHPEPSDREMDMLLSTGEQTTIALVSMALQHLSIPAISLTGAQAGIVTDSKHTKARISNITPKAIHESLDKGNVVIVAGFQGQTPEGHITTLGRGGSDLTAIALAGVLKADLCQIYTDVDGVYTADPRIVPDARKIPEISYDEMLEMASLGSKVMQARSVEFAAKFGVRFEVRSSFNDAPGTIIKGETKTMEQEVLRGVSIEKNQAKVTIRGVPDTPGIAARVFSPIAAADINVDMIIQNVSSAEGDKRATDITFTINRDDLTKARRIIEPIVKEVGAREMTFHEGIAKLSVVGIGMRSHSGVAAKLFNVLAEEKVNIQMISTSEIKISIIIQESESARAAQAVHKKFGLSGK